MGSSFQRIMSFCLVSASIYSLERLGYKSKIIRFAVAPIKSFLFFNSQEDLCWKIFDY